MQHTPVCTAAISSRSCVCCSLCSSQHFNSRPAFYCYAIPLEFFAPGTCLSTAVPNCVLHLLIAKSCGFPFLSSFPPPKLLRSACSPGQDGRPGFDSTVAAAAHFGEELPVSGRVDTDRVGGGWSARHWNCRRRTRASVSRSSVANSAASDSAKARHSPSGCHQAGRATALLGATASLLPCLPVPSSSSALPVTA